MVLVYTSVWIRFLANRLPWAAELDGLLERGEAAGHDLVYGELLIGDTGGQDRFLKSYDLIHRIPAVEHAEVSRTDAHLLASALAADASLWTADARLAGVAGELGVAYGARSRG